MLSTKLVTLALVACGAAIPAPNQADNGIKGRQINPPPVCPDDDPQVTQCRGWFYDDCLVTGYPCAPDSSLSQEACENYCRASAVLSCHYACK